MKLFGNFGDAPFWSRGGRGGGDDRENVVDFLLRSLLSTGTIGADGQLQWSVAHGIVPV